MNPFEILDESQILNPVYRKRVIEFIENNKSNQYRKNESYKRYDCMKDKTIKYVLELLLQQFEPQTVYEMQYAMSNISVTRKIVDKLARVYSNGVKRSYNKKKETVSIEKLSDLMSFNNEMKKINKLFKLDKNTLIHCFPFESKTGWEIGVRAYPMFLYDVLYKKTHTYQPKVIILSDYNPRSVINYSPNPATAGRIDNNYIHESLSELDDYCQMSNNDKFKQDKEYIWWSDSYHFTTDSSGEIKSKGDNKNPLGELPFVDFTLDKDCAYWSQGGKDLADGGIKINALLTNVNHVSITQGYGQLVMKGKELPKSIKTGPNHCIQLVHQDKDDPEPSAEFLSANPPVEELMKTVEMMTALLLSTNNLSTSGFSMNLSDSRQFASGIAMLIDKAESIEDIKEQQEVYIKSEPIIWDKIYKWINIYKEKNLLSDNFKPIIVPEDPMSVKIEFPSVQTIMSESEKLDIMSKRKDLGISTNIDLIRMDNPSFTEEQVLEKLEQINEEKKANMEAFSVDKQIFKNDGIGNQEDDNQDQGD